MWKPIIGGALACFAALLLSVGFAIAALLVIPEAEDLATTFVAFFFLTAILFIVWYFQTYAQVLAVHRLPTIRATARKVPEAMLPLAYLAVLLFGISFVWAPWLAWPLVVFSFPGNEPVILISFMVAVVLTLLLTAIVVPRTIFAPVILLSEQTTLLESIRLSVKRAKGKWFITAAYLCGMAILSGAFSSVVSRASDLPGEWLMNIAAMDTLEASIFAIGGFVLVGLMLMLPHAFLHMFPLVFTADLHAALKKAKK